MAKWHGTFLVGLLIGFAVTAGTASAQGPGNAQPPSTTAWLLTLIVFAPFIVVILLLLPALRRAKRNSEQVARSIAMSEESLRLERERVALQQETNRLLEVLIEKVGRR
jgi:hypothetical protein